MSNRSLYIVTTSIDFWWSVYGLDEPTSSEYVWIYDIPDDSGEVLAWISVGSKQRLREIMESEGVPVEAPASDSAHAAPSDETELRRLLHSDQMECRYLYDAPDALASDKPRELPYPNLPKNDHGVLPSLIEMVPPTSYLEWDALKSAVLAFCAKFLGIEADKVVPLRRISIEEAIESYIEFTSDLFGTPTFSETHIDQIAKRSGRTTTEIHKKITDTLKKYSS